MAWEEIEWPPGITAERQLPSSSSTGATSWLARDNTVAAAASLKEKLAKVDAGTRAAKAKIAKLKLEEEAEEDEESESEGEGSAAPEQSEQYEMIVEKLAEKRAALEEELAALPPDRRLWPVEEDGSLRCVAKLYAAPPALTAAGTIIAFSDALADAVGPLLTEADGLLNAVAGIVGGGGGDGASGAAGAGGASGAAGVAGANAREDSEAVGASGAGPAGDSPLGRAQRTEAVDGSAAAGSAAAGGAGASCGGLLPLLRASAVKSESSRVKSTLAALFLPYCKNGSVLDAVNRVAGKRSVYWFSDSLILRNFRAIIAALAALQRHAATAHGNIKPTNVFVSDDGGALLLGDFLIPSIRSKLVGDLALGLAAKHAYLAPELRTRLEAYTRAVDAGAAAAQLSSLERQIDWHKADVFSLGLVMAFVVTRQEPTKANRSTRDLEALLKKFEGRHDSELTTLLTRMLTWDPAQRPSFVDLLSFGEQTALTVGGVFEMVRGLFGF